MALCNFRRGDTKQYTITVRDSNGVVLDISVGYTITFIMKTSKHHSDVEGLPNVLGPVTATILDGPNGVAAVLLSSTETNQLEPVTYYYEFRIQYTGAVPNVVSTIEAGKLNVLESLSI